MQDGGVKLWYAEAIAKGVSHISTSNQVALSISEMLLRENVSFVIFTHSSAERKLPQRRTLPNK